MTRRRGPAVALALLALAAGGCTTDASGTASSDAGPGLVTTRCADLVVLGARGSTQSPDANAGVGTEVRRSVEALARRLHARSDTSVRLEAVRYDASASTYEGYRAHVVAGAAMMTEQLAAVTSACPDSRVALVGFSQGAQVVHGAAIDVPASRARRLALVAMIADPRHDPADDITQWGYAAQPVAGDGRLGSGTPIDADLRAVAISLCVEGDEICNDQGAPGGPPSDTHKHFYEKPSTARATARQLDRILERAGV